MFNKLKQFKDLRDQAKQLQNALAEEVIETESHGIKMAINGNLELVSLELNPDLGKEDQEKYLKNLFNDLVKKAQQKMAEKVRGMGGLGGLGGMLGM